MPLLDGPVIQSAELRALSDRFAGDQADKVERSDDIASLLIVGFAFACLVAFCYLSA